MKIAKFLTVTGLAASDPQGWLRLGAMSFRCGVGRSGRCVMKREGDGASPIGVWRLVEVFYRFDRVLRPRTALPIRALRPADGWCDAVGDRNYNRRVRHPYPASAELLWRNDHLYDLVVVLSHNSSPRVQRGGSAIFMHLDRAGFAPTAGCVALTVRDLRYILAHAGPTTRLNIRA